MLFWKYSFPLYNVPDGSGGEAAPASSTPSTPSEPPAGAPKAADDVIDETADFVLEAFEQLQIDDEPEMAPEIPPGADTQQAVPPVAIAPLEQPPVAPASTQVAPPPGPTPPVQQAAQPPAQPTVAQTPSQPQAPQAPVAASGTPTDDFDAISKALGEQEEQFTQALAQQVYKLSEKELEQVQTDPGAIIPQLMARAQVRTMASAMKVFSQQMPKYINAALEQRTKVEQNKAQFWNVLKQKGFDQERHLALANFVVPQVRQANPQLGGQGFLDLVANEMLRVVGGALAQQQAQPPAAQVVRTPGPVVRNGATPPGYRPIGANSAPPGMLPGAQKGEWEIAFEEMLRE